MRRASILVLAVLMGLLTQVTVTAPAHAAAVTVTNATQFTDTTGAVLQYACGSGTNQQWLLDDLGTGYYHLVARHSGKCLDVTSAATADGARLIQYTCGTGTNQQWQRTQV